MCERLSELCRFMCDDYSDTLVTIFPDACDAISLFVKDGEVKRWADLPSKITEVVVRFDTIIQIFNLILT